MGHPLIVSVRVPHDDPATDLGKEAVFHTTLASWPKGGFVDRAIVFLWRGKGNGWSPENDLFGPGSVEQHVQALEGTRASLCADVYQGTWPIGGGPDRDVSIARQLFAQGADGGFSYCMRSLVLQVFHDAITGESPNELDVYTAMEATLPGIVAAESAAAAGRQLDVPEIRPGSARTTGAQPPGVVPRRVTLGVLRPCWPCARLLCCSNPSCPAAVIVPTASV